MRVALVLCIALHASGCGIVQQMAGDNDDVADYKAFRVASRPGLRLGRAQQYLEAHPRGRWVSEVREAFEAEEPLFFERCQESRDLMRDYLVDLPHGPHADAAMSLLVAFDTKVEDMETVRLRQRARRTEAELDSAARKRRAIGEMVLGAVGALTADNVYGARIESASALLRSALGGAVAPTWGSLPPRREADLFFVIPTREGREARVATITLRTVLDGDAIVEGRIEGYDLFVRWDEADLVHLRDASSPKDRSEAAFHAQELLAGALEARMPASRCTVARGEHELLHRSCGGWTAAVVWGEREGNPDVISIRGPIR